MQYWIYFYPGVGGDGFVNLLEHCNNFSKFDLVSDEWRIHQVVNGRIKKDDFVIILWSSSLRDYAAFLPRHQWVSWSVKHLLERPDKFISSYKSSNSTYDSFLKDYKNFF